MGTRSVSAQFRDGALNTSSPPVTASIQLDTTPLPVATLVSTNFDENAGNVELVVVLDHIIRSRWSSVTLRATGPRWLEAISRFSLAP